MAIPAAVVILPLGLLFFFSGLIINLIQGILYVIIRPISKNGYRRINRMVTEVLWIQLVWILDWWAGVKVQVYTDSETLKHMGKEHALLIPNHKSDIDWLIGWVLAQRSGCLGSSFAVMKKSSKLLPVIGWSMWFSEYLFLERSWAKDENTLKVLLHYIHIFPFLSYPEVVKWVVRLIDQTLSGQNKSCLFDPQLLSTSLISHTLTLWCVSQLGFKRLKDYPRPFWLGLFVEGTRFTQAKLLAAQEYASSNALHVPRNVLIPRTKGFVTSVNQLRSFVPAIYDITVAIPRNSPPPTMMRLFKGQSSVVHVKLKRHLMKDLPETDEAVAQWCKDLFVAKDDLLDKYKAADAFPDSEPHDIGRPLKSLVVVASWACLLIFGTFKFFQWSNLFSSWKGITITSLCLAVVTVLMQILIQFTQSERSTPAKVAPSRSDEGFTHTQHDKNQ